METSEVTSERNPLLPNEPCAASMATPPSSLGKNKSCHILNRDSRNTIFHCYTCWRNREPEHSVADTSKFAADMLGVSERTVFRSSHHLFGLKQGISKRNKRHQVDNGGTGGRNLKKAEKPGEQTGHFFCNYSHNKDGMFDILHAKYIKHFEGALCCMIVGSDGGKGYGS
ncbi:hypothetical protein HPB52_025188 [Rhipicephalus sanguineus]|uniref:Uncharacterized protein n=1 Tax=Rhipicephalus sanguineus TaxID=34632 RepID=A0A9D4TDB9_RHISA|nr:hypothetical protein HPB52_025188 [Rhipicephalus sanguineus]